MIGRWVIRAAAIIAMVAWTQALWAQTTVQYQVAALYDDTFCTTSSNYATNSTMSFPENGDNVRSFCRWAVSIPAGATVQSATLKVKCCMTRQVDTSLRLWLVDSDNCPAFSINPYASSLAAGTDVVWTMPYFTVDQWYTSVDITTLVQAFVSRPGYASGNYLGLMGQWNSGTYRKVYQYSSGAPTSAAILEVTYSTNVAPTADAGDDQNVTDNDDSGYETVTLDGTGSSDSDGTIDSYVWTEGGSPIATGSTADVSLAVGTHDITLTVTDDDAATHSDSVTVVVNEAPDQFTVQYQVASLYDDTFCTSGSNAGSNSTMSFPENSDAGRTFFRWAVGIPNNATILSATLRVKASMDRAVNAGVRLALVDSDNCPSFNVNPYASTVVGATETDWSMPPFVLDQWYASVDVSDIVQAYVDRPGYVAGSYLGLRGQWISGTYHKVYQYSTGAPTNAAVLEITYAGGNFPPTADAGTDQVLPDTSFDGSELVTFDGTGSSDSDGTIASYVWSEDSVPIAAGATAQAVLSVGTHTITLTVTDNDGATATDTMQVFVHPVFYVDFEGGSDADSGMSPGEAWQHCPGDPNATGVPASIGLIGGDKVIFKGGAVYRGRINCNWSGSEGLPIVYDGNTAGTWGTGKAIFDGSEALSGWTPCQSADDAGGNPNWANMWYAYAPAGTTAGTSNLYQNDGNETLCAVAQSPNPGDPLFADDINHFYTVDCDDVTMTTLTDATVLTQTDPGFWSGAYVMIWRLPNVIDMRSITGFDPATDTITFGALGNTPYTDRDEKYALYNHISLLDTAGEYYFNETPEGDGTHKVWLWPPAGNPNTHPVSISVPSQRHSAFVLGSDLCHVVFEGLVMRKYAGGTTYGGPYGGAGINANGKQQSHVTVRDCEFFGLRHDFLAGNGYGGLTLSGDHHLVEGNSFVELPMMNAMQFSVSETTIQNNYIERPGRIGLWMVFTNCQILGNVFTGVYGGHADAIAVYLGSSNVLVMGNTVLDSALPLCVKSSSNVTVAYNFLDSPTGYAFADWGGCTNLKVHNNLMIRDDNMPAFTSASGCDSANNIYYDFAGNASLTPDANHNLKIIHSMDATIFEDAANGDYHLKSGSPAVDAGEDLGYEYDIEGVSVPQNDPDIGPFEYVP